MEELMPHLVELHGLVLVFSEVQLEELFLHSEYL